MTVLCFLFSNAEGFIDKTAVWTAALTVVTLILVLVAWAQLSKIKKIAKADFVKRLNDSFFTEETRNLVVLLFNSAIEYTILPIKDSNGKSKIDELPCFRIKNFVLKQLKTNGLIELPAWRKGYNAFEIDDFLLGPLDDVGGFEKQGLLDFQAVDRTFGYYIRELVGKNEGVKKYLKDPECQGNYDNLMYIYKKLISRHWLIKYKFWHQRIIEK